MNDNAPDLSQWDDDYDGTQTPEHNFDDIADGDYDTTLDKLVVTTSTSGSPVVKFLVKIDGPNFVGRTMWKTDGIATKQNLEYLKKDLTICGYVGKLSQLAARADEFRGVRLKVKVKNKGGYTNYYINKRIGEPSTASPPVEDQSPASALDPSDPVPF
jgi:hypothetical protein